MNKNKTPAFQFYPNDWLSSPKIMLMTPAEEGGYIRLLCICWTNGSLPDDDNELARLSRLDKLWFNGASEKIRKCFFRRGKKLYNKRLMKERTKQRLWQQKSREGGIASAKARKNKRLGVDKQGKDGSEIVPTKGQPKGNSSSSSSIYSPNSDEFRLAELLFSEIRKRKLDHKKPDLEKWAKQIDLMIRRENRKPAHIREVILWCQSDDFWQNNILSTAKLRKQFDQLELRMQQQSPRPITVPLRRNADGLTPREVYLAKIKKENNGRRNT